MKNLTEVLKDIPDMILTKYDFSNAIYKGALVPLTNIVCSTHGEFQQYTGNLRKGVGCPSCGGAKRARSRSASAGDYFVRVSEVHNGFYTYPEQDFINMHSLITVCCPVHGEFNIRPLKHLYSKQGCPQCGAIKRGKRLTDVNVGALAAKKSISKHRDLFLQRAQAIHGDLYDYSKVDYTGVKKDITIICKKHGEYSQRPEKHLYEGQGCPKCGQKSSQEQVIADYLKIFTTVEQRNRSILKPKELDIYLPEHNLAIEYSGMYWHSHGSIEDENKNKNNHYNKYKACEQLGIRLITIYETEWQDRQKAVKRLLRNAVGKSKGKLMARKCDIRPVLHKEAKDFYDKYHPQGGAGSGEHYGLYWKDKLVACMRFTYGVNDRGSAAANRVWTLSRYATRVTISGGASRLFKAFVQEHNPDEIKSFSDNRYFSGVMYTQLGFDLIENATPDYQIWSMKAGLKPKSHYQRRNIVTRLKDHGVIENYNADTDTRTEREMTYLMGARRIYDCGKKKWIWSK